MGQARARNVSAPSGLTTIAQGDFLQQLVGRLVGFPDPVDNLVRFGRILQLDADSAVNAKSFNGLKIGKEIDDAPAWREVTVNPAIGLPDVDVNRLSSGSVALRGTSRRKVQ